MDTQLEERTGEAFEGDIRLTVIGSKLRPGSRAPDFRLDALAPGEGLPREITLASTAGRVRLLHVVNSLDTPVCHIGTHQFETRRLSDLPARRFLVRGRHRRSGRDHGKARMALADQHAAQAVPWAVVVFRVPAGCYHRVRE